MNAREAIAQVIADTLGTYDQLVEKEYDTVDAKAEYAAMVSELILRKLIEKEEWDEWTYETI
tara:strand:- start:1617 stop:1802 length:186 start_codon:yes stop_codon:yes gene_type:complete